MTIDVQKFKVVYDERVLRAIAVTDFVFKENEYPGKLDSNIFCKPVLLTVLCLDENGSLTFITDEAWRFQFIPVIQGGNRDA